MRGPFIKKLSIIEITSLLLAVKIIAGSQDFIYMSDMTLGVDMS